MGLALDVCLPHRRPFYPTSLSTPVGRRPVTASDELKGFPFEQKTSLTENSLTPRLAVFA